PEDESHGEAPGRAGLRGEAGYGECNRAGRYPQRDFTLLFTGLPPCATTDGSSGAKSYGCLRRGAAGLCRTGRKPCAPRPSWSTIMLRPLVALAFASAAGTASAADEPVPPKEVTPLFDGKTLTGLTPWLKDTKREDPNKVFRVTDGMIHITGEGFGYL